jgi:uncharacterized glyoxalase superfamily protein PhnB
MSQVMYPVLRYRDADAAIDFLKRAFGFEEKAVHRGERNGDVHHAELELAGGMVMLGSMPSPDQTDRLQTETGPTLVYVALGNIDAHHARAKDAGAEVGELVDQDYGSREYVAKDPEGNTWSFGTYRP